MKTVAAVAAACLLAMAAAPAGAGTRTGRHNFVEQQWALERIGAPQAWTHSTGEGALVAIVDSGIDLGHPDLRDNIKGTGRDFVDDDGVAQDEHGHGTHVAGIVAAVKDNGRGIVGVAPEARLLPVRVLDENNTAPIERVIEGIKWAARRDADVINVSVSWPVPLYGQSWAATQRQLSDAIGYAWEYGAVVVLSAGNTYQPLCDTSSAPALCVGATGASDSKASYSSFDASMTEDYLVAPGGDGSTSNCDLLILSTWLRSKPRADACSPDSGYAATSGTSMAAPMVAGVAALLAGDGLDNDEIMARILGTTTDLGLPGRDPVYGYGLVDAEAAVAPR